MKSVWFFAIAFFYAAGCSRGGGDSGPSGAASTEILALDQVRALPKGSPGFIRTVVEGTTPSDLTVSFFDVIGEGADGVILAKTTDDRFKTYGGVVAGMSGSPLYLTDPLRGDYRPAGALFATFLAQQPGEGYFFLVQPIETMLSDLLFAPRRAPKKESKWKEALQAAIGPGTFTPIPPAHMMTGVSQERIDRYIAAVDPADPVLSSLKDQKLFAAEAKPGVSANTSFAPGESLTAKLITGDIVSWGAIGTVTWTDGAQLLAFGHPFLGSGPTAVPFSGARVYAIVSNLFLPFKLALSGDPVFGTITRDTDRGVRGVLGPAPVLFSVNAQAVSEGKTFIQPVHHEVAYTDFLPIATAFTAVVPANLLYKGGPDATLSYTLDLSFKETGSHLVRQDGVSRNDPFPEAFVDLWRIMSFLWFSDLNQVALLTPTLLNITVTVTEGRTDLELLDVTFPTPVVRGQPLTLTLQLLPFRQTVQTQQATLNIPPDFPTGAASLTLRSAASDEDWGIATNADELLANLGARRRHADLKISLESTGASLEQALPLAGPIVGVINKSVAVN